MNFAFCGGNQIIYSLVSQIFMHFEICKVIHQIWNSILEVTDGSYAIYKVCSLLSGRSVSASSGKAALQQLLEEAAIGDR